MIGIMLFLHQRGLPQTETKRNLVLIMTILLFGGSFLLILYAGFGDVWWASVDFQLGSYVTVLAVLQILSDLIFGNVFVGVAYIILVGVILGIVAHSTLIPVEPDIVAMQSELNETIDENEQLRKDLHSIEAENKQLQVFLSEKESSLTVIQSELESLRAAAVEAAKAPIDEMPPEVDQDLLASISEKDEQIQLLENRIIELETRIVSLSETSTPSAMSPDLVVKEKLLAEFTRRAETATQVADSVISDTMEVISMIQGSNLDESAKLTLIKLIETLRKSLTKVAGSPELKDKQEPKIEMIGAVMMVHEIVDVVKKMSRT